MMREKYDRFRLLSQVVFFVVAFLFLHLLALPFLGLKNWLLPASLHDLAGAVDLAVALACAGLSAWKLLDILVDVWDAFALFFFSPLFKRRWRKFTSIKRGYWSFILVVTLFILSFFSEFLINNKAILVKYQGKYHFTLFSFRRASEFGMTGFGLPNYRQLKVLYANQSRERAERLRLGTGSAADQNYRDRWGDDWVLLPPYPYGPEESLLSELPGRPPHPPTWLSKSWRIFFWDEGWYQLPKEPPSSGIPEEWRQLEPGVLYKQMAIAGMLDLKPGMILPKTLQHPLGTDDRGRDVFARMVYGFRISLSFALLVMLFSYSIGITVGALLGYYGGRFDIVMQRFVEIWSSLPFLYTVMIISAIILPNFLLLVSILVLFGWMGMTYFIRAEFLREKSRDYVSAAVAMGCSDGTIIFRHILPNALTPVISFAPFEVIRGIGSLVSLDFLGFGLPQPTSSWGELFGQGLANLQSPWLGLSPMLAMFATLLLVSFIGEAMREAFDPKEYSRLR